MRSTATFYAQATRFFCGHGRVSLMVSTCLLFTLVASVSVAQVRGPAKVEDPKLKPRPVTLKTRDNISLRAFYFPSAKGKEAIPVLLIHEWQGQSSPYVKLVDSLREAGCAVLVFDYRGHGGSKEYVTARGNVETFNVSMMGKQDIERIIKFDIEEAKQFLKKENDDGNLNINALVLVGIREGCVMAAQFAANDWAWPSVGRIKQGQDVKALVMISPEKLVKGVSIDLPLRAPTLLQLPIMIVAGDSSAEAAEANRIGKRIEAVKRRFSQGEPVGFNQLMVKTSLSGPALVNESAEVLPAITQFINSSVLINDSTNPWIKRN